MRLMTEAAPHPVAPSAILARVPTERGSRYLQQLARHWSHKFEVVFTPTEATIPLPFGLCELKADDAGIDIRLSPRPDADVERFRTVVADHLQRFGHRETLVFDWRDA